MTTYNVGSDHSGKGDSECINRVCELLNNAGHTANPLGVTPNLEGQLTSRPGVGVFIVNGLCIGTVKSCSDDLRGDGKIIFAIPKMIYTGSVPLPDGLKTQPLQLVQDGTNWSESYRELNGKTWAEVCGSLNNIEYVYGETCDDIAQAIIDGNFGEGSSSGTTDSKKEGSIMSGWESITDLLKPLDGEAMVVVRGDAVIIKRIYPPDSTKLWVYEGVNVVDDSVTVSDYSPEIYNTFVVNWGAEYENQMEVSFTKHKKLFGERKTEVRASYPVPVDEAPQMSSSGALLGENAETEESESDVDGGDIVGSIFGFLTGGGGGGASSVSAEDMGMNLGTDNMGTGTGEEENPTAEVPITDEAEAYLFGLKQVGKARRKSGHQVECKVIGSKYWEVGEWCRVYLPTFNEDSIMFISKVSHESGADSEWITSLTLVDYPPSLGTGQSNTPSENSGTEQTDQGIINSLPVNGAEENTDTGENTQNG